MTLTEHFLMGFQAYQEIKQELQPGEVTDTAIVEYPDLAKLLTDLGPMPEGSLLMGMAFDGLPVLLNLHDPAPGPILVVGDGHCGKTTLLQFLARGSDLLNDPGDIQFAAVTHFPEEWADLESLPNSMGIWPAYHRAGRQFLSQLVDKMEASVHGRQIILLLLDDLELMVNVGVEFQNNLHWVLLNGPARQVWPVVTINARRIDEHSFWLRNFHTLIFGHVENPKQVNSLLNGQLVDLPSLQPGSQFSLLQSSAVLRFWIPVD